jgi:Phage late-transcription coactivator
LTGISSIGNNSQFALDIENVVWELDVNYIDALQIYCDRRGLEVESIAKMVQQDKILLEKVRSEGEELFILKTEGAKLKL